MKRAIVGVLVISLGLLLKSCNTTEPPDNNNDQDSTSHNFTWQTWTFGEHSSSVLYDVAIIDENSIWAVGEIYINDSLGQPDPIAYNAVHWDGISWKLKKIYFPTVCSSTNLTPYPARAIFTFNDGKIWISSSGDKMAILQYGLQIDQFCLPTHVSMSINKIWGSSSSDLFVVGVEGNIAHYDGISWEKIDSGTDLNINDIWGIINKDGSIYIICPAYDFGSGGKKKLLSISNNVVGEIPWVENRELYTVWFNTTNKIYAGGEGLFYRTKNQWTEVALPAFFKFRVRGEEFNDIWTVGGFGFAAHYNGLNWKTFEEVSLASGNYLGLAVNSKIVAMVGNEGNKAIITLGTR